MALYKAGYYEIDSATNFVLPEEVIKEFQEKINTHLVDTEAYAETIRQAVSDISDISVVWKPVPEKLGGTVPISVSMKATAFTQMQMSMCWRE